MVRILKRFGLCGKNYAEFMLWFSGLLLLVEFVVYDEESAVRLSEKHSAAFLLL